MHLAHWKTDVFSNRNRSNVIIVHCDGIFNENSYKEQNCTDKYYFETYLRDHCVIGFCDRECNGFLTWQTPYNGNSIHQYDIPCNDCPSVAISCMIRIIVGLQFPWALEVSIKCHLVTIVLCIDDGCHTQKGHIVRHVGFVHAI